MISRESQILSISNGEASVTESFEILLGLAWTPEQFVEKAKKCDHPSAAIAAPDEIIQAILSCVKKRHRGTGEHQLGFKRKWEAEAKELQQDEEQICSLPHDDVAPLARKKHPLLLTAMLDELGFGPSDLVLTFAASGCPMFTLFPKTCVFP